MILTCPQCSTRYQADAAKFMPAGRNVKCARCGHLWHQAPPLPESDHEISIVEPTPVPAAPANRSETEASHPAAYTGPVPQTQTLDEESDEAAPRWPQRAASAVGWLALGFVVFLVGWTAVSFRQDIATLWPQTASFYNAVGLTVNARGLEFVEVANRVEQRDGTTVLVVSGKLVNVSGRELPVPPLRVALVDAGRRELFHWPIETPASTLKPGETVPFLTRYPNPPRATHDVEVTFDRGSE